MIVASGIDEVLQYISTSINPVEFFFRGEKNNGSINTLNVRWNYKQYIASDGSPIAGYEFICDSDAQIEMPNNTRVGCVLEPHCIFMDEIVHRDGDSRYYTYHSSFSNNGDNVLKPLFKYLDGSTIKSIPLPQTTGLCLENTYDVYVDSRTQTYHKEYSITHELGAGFRFAGGPRSIWDTVSMYVEVNVPIFKNNTDLEEYLRTGNMSKSVNNLVPSSGQPTIWYYDYNESDMDPDTLSLYNTVNYKAEFKLINDTDKVRYVKLDDKHAELVFNCTSVLLKDGRNYIETPVTDLKKDVILNANVNNRVGDLYTNIPIVEDFEDDPDFGNNFTIIPEDNYTGTKSDMDNTELFGVISPLGCYHVNNNDFERIKNILYTTDLQAIEYLKSGLWQYNETPVNCVIDICYIPFNIDAYVIKSPKLLQFGSLVCDGESDPIPRISLSNIITSTSPVTNVNMTILPTYNDFRDYETVSYSLYLPYYGIIELDGTVVGSNLRVKSYFDAWTTELKYYVYIDSSLVGSYSCNVGKHISVLGNDWMNKSRQNVDYSKQLAFDTAKASTSALALNPLGTAVSGLNAIEDLQGILEKPSTMTRGTMSSGNNIHDDMNFYLIIEQFETIKPTNLYSMYGIPCFLITSLDKCKGFTMVSDCRLRTSATSDEMVEILNLLREGIII